MQEAAQPPPPVCPARTLLTCTDGLANLRHWIRRTGHGRLAARVHFSAKPMWILRCRTVLLDLAASLCCVPIDVAAVVTHLSVLWMLPRKVFTIPSRGGAAAQRLKYNRINRRLADHGFLVFCYRGPRRVHQLALPPPPRMCIPLAADPLSTAQMAL